ncbi:MAG: ECF RNA polymerase sigma factor SigR [candidate division WS2 bacterium]|nr:ECF RNA polymerase sigma factor SigR [Candidatus Lithacetigena glycinireducens]
MSILDYFKSKELIFEEKFLAYLNDIYRTALRLTQNKDDAEDLTQETFLKAYEAFSKGTKVSSPKAWLFKIMHNTFINQKTSLSGRAENISLEEIPEIQTPETPEDVLLLKTAEGRLAKAIKSMPSEYRLTLLLCDSEGLSYSEVAGVMQCPVGTVRSRLNRAREIVKNALIEDNKLPMRKMSS